MFTQVFFFVFFFPPDLEKEVALLSAECSKLQPAVAWKSFGTPGQIAFWMKGTPEDLRSQTTFTLEIDLNEGHHLFMIIINGKAQKSLEKAR